MTRREFSLSLTAAGLRGAAHPGALEYQTAGQVAQALRAKKISAVELMQATWSRIDSLNPKLNAVILPFREQSLARAREADAALARKVNWGPLHGVPVTIKEAFSMAGVATCAGVQNWLKLVPKNDADVVTRLRQAGAIIVGKTNVPVMLMDWQSFNPIYGSTNNPWDTTRTPGGSSGGSAAALAAGMGYLSVGSDIGGSIRVPSHFCGTYGHKPSLNLVSFRGHVPPPAPNGEPVVPPDMACAGPMARSAADLRLELESLAGPTGDEAEAYTYRMPAPRRQRLQDFRVGYVFNHPRCLLAPDVGAVFERALSALSKAGARLTEGFPPALDLNASYETYSYLLGSLVNLDAPPDQVERMREAARSSPPDSMRDSAFQPYRNWMGATARRLLLRALWQDYFRNFDVFLMPVEFVPAFPHDHAPQHTTVPSSAGPRPYMDMLFWPHFAIVTGLPSTAAPLGLTQARLPVGLQILGPFLEDATPIEFAARMEPVTGGFVKPPGY